MLSLQAMKILLCVIGLLLPMAAVAEEVRIELGMSEREAVAAIEKHSGVDISGGMAMGVILQQPQQGQPQAAPMAPLKGVFWEFREYNAMVELSVREGKVMRMVYWTKEDFGTSKEHRAKSSQAISALKLEPATKGVVTEPEVPVPFMPAEGRLRDVLQRPVSGEFRAAPISDVFGALCRQIPANWNYASGSTDEPVYSGTFKKTPFRTALYQVAQATKLNVTLEDRGDGVMVVKVRP